MRSAIIGRTEWLYETALHLKDQGHEIAIIVTAKEAPEYTRTAADFKDLASKLGAAFIHSAKISETIGVIRKLGRLDIGVSAFYPGIIPQAVIDLFPLGILNAHGGDLPRYRGNACQAWAILAGEKRVGYCIHKMIGDELDSGDIISRDYFPLDINTKVTAVHQWMGRRTPELFAEALRKLAKDPTYVLERQSKDPKDALRCYPRGPEDGRIDWARSNVEVLRLVNACNKPYAGAFCDLEGRRVIIWDAALVPEENFLAIPGQITRIGEGFVEVATGVQKIRVNQIEIEGEVMSPDQLIRSSRKRFV